MSLLSGRRRQARDRVADDAVDRERAEQEKARRRLLEVAERQRRERDRSVPPEHRASEAERRPVTP